MLIKITVIGLITVATTVSATETAAAAGKAAAIKTTVVMKEEQLSFLPSEKNRSFTLSIKYLFLLPLTLNRINQLTITLKKYYQFHRLTTAI